MTVTNSPVYPLFRLDINGSYIDNIRHNEEIIALDKTAKYEVPKPNKIYSLHIFVIPFIFICISLHPLINPIKGFDIRSSIFCLITSYFNGSKYKGAALIFA